MLMIMILSSGQMLVRSMVEEKSNRIVEILISSCSPTDLMFGKIVGISMLGVVQLLFWGLIGMLLILAVDLDNLPLDNIGLMVVYFFLGFLLYASIFVAFGSLASTEQEGAADDGIPDTASHAANRHRIRRDTESEQPAACRALHGTDTHIADDVHASADHHAAHLGNCIESVHSRTFHNVFHLDRRQNFQDGHVAHRETAGTGRNNSLDPFMRLP
jgi:hypothetical protein